MRMSILYSVILFSQFGCCPSSFKQLSKEIQLAHNGNSTPSRRTFHEIRRQVYAKEKIRIDNILKSDTCFLLEEFVNEEGLFLMRIWSMQDSLSFKSLKGVIETTENPFTPYTCHLIEKWDTITIREQEKLFSSMVPRRWQYGTRVVKKSKIHYINTVRFFGFFNVDRDRNNSEDG